MPAKRKDDASKKTIKKSTRTLTPAQQEWHDKVQITYKQLKASKVKPKIVDGKLLNVFGLALRKAAGKRI